ncbi:MAG: bifunctional metallophosphatase/5'-nucleotidase, partial [Clostridia bacterium]|nr:bifunctional metallophosphatase/5'-nucleotidase [Clostridia bacterium]
ATYLNNAKNTDDNVILLSSGDMWQGSAESVLTEGVLLTEWMNQMGFSAMTLGNHEYDWGEDAIRENLKVAEFPFLAINIYDKDTNALAEYCTPSVIVEREGIRIGIIGAIGDCYSSVSSDMVEDVEFKVGKELTALVKAESERLRDAGADLIVYSVHDGSGTSSSGVQNVSAYSMSAYYDVALSDGYVDLVFEAHSHQSYTLIDVHSVYHLQGGGENRGISHVEIEVNSVSGENEVTEAEIVRHQRYESLSDDPATEALEEKYRETIDRAYRVLGRVDRSYSSGELGDLAAELYLEAGLEKWGADYDIVLGGGYLVTRSPYDLAGGECSYADLLSLFPFNNRLALCSISGAKLQSKFLQTGNSNYHIGLSDYGRSIQDNVSYGKTYYVVVDTYTALYAPNGLTVIDYYDESTYARDLFADAIGEGRFSTDHSNYTLTPIPEALAIGKGLDGGETTKEYYYVKGVITGSIHATYGNLYLSDGEGNSIYV